MIGVDDLRVIVLFGVSRVLSDSVDVSVLQFVSTDVALSWVNDAVWPVSKGQGSGFLRLSGVMWIVIETC